jgi:hypothetical protein
VYRATLVRCPLSRPAEARYCRIAIIVQAHTHALLGIFDRGSMATTIADSTASVRCEGKPIADLARVAAGCIVTAEMPDRPDLASWCEAGW